MKLLRTLLPYMRLLVALVGVFFAASYTPALMEFLEHSSEAELTIIFFETAILFSLSFLVFYVSSGTSLPPFVTAIFFGMAGKPLLGDIVGHHALLGALVGVGATLILFGGGLETPFFNFRKLFWKILLLSFPGLIFTSITFSYVGSFLGEATGAAISITALVLLGAVLASTDPAAIIPILKKLRFKNRETKDIIVSESALTDVSGTLVTVTFLSILTAGATFTSIEGAYTQLFTASTAIFLAQQLFFGILFGLLGYGLLEALIRFKTRHEQEHEVDAAFFLCVPLVIFAVALAFGGSGYLAAFVAGLLFSITEHLHESERFFNHTIDGFLKPTIFLLLGALVEFDSLLEYAGIGILAALVFMFVIRPVSVFLVLGPLSIFGKKKLSVRELLFISFVRETGAIPAVLLVTIVTLNLPGMEGFLAIGMWVILLTLIIEPPLTPFVARMLKVATPIEDAQAIDLSEAGVPSVVLGTRGHSFLKRLQFVTDWAVAHQLKGLVVLLCLEDKYSKELEEETEAQAKEAFEAINKKLKKGKKQPLQFTFISRKGFLQNNIDKLADERDSSTVAIFVGRKMLDFRLDQIKNLHVPLYFLD